MTPVFLIRHAKARSRASWREADQLRPLTKRGRRQAAALPAHFAGQPFSRLVASPFVRCVQTLEPLAEDRGLPIEQSSSLAEGTWGEAALELMRSLAGAGAVACCTHGDVVLGVVRELAGVGVSLVGPAQPEVAGTWVLVADEHGFASGRYLAPPS